MNGRAPLSLLFAGNVHWGLYRILWLTGCPFLNAKAEPSGGILISSQKSDSARRKPLPSAFCCACSVLCVSHPDYAGSPPLFP
jgi:hypothetical protein